MTNPAFVRVNASPAHQVAEDEARLAVITNLAESVRRFLTVTFPRSAGAPARDLATALADYLAFGIEQRIEELKNYKPLPAPPGFYPPDPTQRLVDLCKRRDMLREQLDAFEELLDKMEDEGGKNDLMVSAMRIQIKVSGLPQALSDIEEQISNLQRSIEAEEPEAK